MKITIEVSLDAANSSVRTEIQPSERSDIHYLLLKALGALSNEITEFEQCGYHSSEIAS